MRVIRFQTACFLFLWSATPVLGWSLSSGSNTPRGPTDVTLFDEPADSRRQFVQSALTVSMALLTTTSPDHAVAASIGLDESLTLIIQARRQLDAVPSLIEQEKWDAVRAILITPPLSDCWAKTARPLLRAYAEALGDADKDELAALEARDEANSHLRYLDMAVYSKSTHFRLVYQRNHFTMPCSTILTGCFALLMYRQCVQPHQDNGGDGGNGIIDQILLRRPHERIQGISGCLG